MGEDRVFFGVTSSAHPEDPGIAGDVEHDEGDCQGDQDDWRQKVVVKVAQNLGQQKHLSSFFTPCLFLFKSSTAMLDTKLIAVMLCSVKDNGDNQ